MAANDFEKYVEASFNDFHCLPNNILNLPAFSTLTLADISINEVLIGLMQVPIKVRQYLKDLLPDPFVPFSGADAVKMECALWFHSEEILRKCFYLIFTNQAQRMEEYVNYQNFIQSDFAEIRSEDSHQVIVNTAKVNLADDHDSGSVDVTDFQTWTSGNIDLKNTPKFSPGMCFSPASSVAWAIFNVEINEDPTYVVNRESITRSFSMPGHENNKNMLFLSAEDRINASAANITYWAREVIQTQVQPPPPIMPVAPVPLLPVGGNSPGHISLFGNSPGNINNNTSIPANTNNANINSPANFFSGVGGSSSSNVGNIGGA